MLVVCNEPNFRWAVLVVPRRIMSSIKVTVFFIDVLL